MYFKSDPGTLLPLMPRNRQCGSDHGVFWILQTARLGVSTAECVYSGRGSSGLFGSALCRFMS